MNGIRNLTKQLIVATFLVFGLIGLARGDPQPWELPIIKEFLVCNAALARACEMFLAGDFEAALKRFESVAGTENAPAQNNVGVMFEVGAGVPTNDAEAILWYGKAAGQGHAVAQYNLAVVLAADHIREAVPEPGRRSPEPGRRSEDFIAAYMWLTLAANQGLKMATTGRETLEEHMTAEQIVEASRLAHKWKPKAQ